MGLIRNGNGGIDWKVYALGALFTISTSLGGFAFSTLQREDAKIAVQLETNDRIQETNRERIATLEQAIKSQSDTLREIKANQDLLIQMHLDQGYRTPRK